MSSVDNVRFLLNPVNLFRNLWKYRQLVRELTWRDISQQYQGSYFGVVWLVIVPLCTLAVYTFVFSVIFKSHWQTGNAASTGEFALILFAGLTAFNPFSAVVSRSPGLILGVPSYVKKVAFPLEVLPVMLA